MEVKNCKVQLQGIIYIDSIFLLNLVMDLYLLSLTARAAGKTVSYARVFAGSAVGALGYCAVLCLPGIPYIKVIFGMIPVGGLMIKIACRARGWRELLRGMGYLFTFSFFLGGFIIFLKGKIRILTEYGDSAAALAGMGFAGYALLQSLLKAYRKRSRNHFCKVRLLGDGGAVAFTALIDTGNALVEPVSQKPVAILEAEGWNSLKMWMKPEKFKLIPYHSIGKDNGMLEGYEIDTMQVEGKDGEKQFDKVIVAVFRGKISGRGGYQMILPPELSA